MENIQCEDITIEINSRKFFQWGNYFISIVRYEVICRGASCGSINRDTAL